MKKFLWTIVVLIVLIAGYVLIKDYGAKTPTITPITTGNVQTGNVQTGLQTYISWGVQFSYPQTFSGNTRRPLSWPPTVNVLALTGDAVALGCPDMKNIAQQTGSVQGKTNGGLNYTLYQGSDVWAGQLYTLYCYVIQWPSNNYVFDITIHSTNGCGAGNCGPYCGTPTEQECKNFDMAKEVAQPINDMITSFKVIK